MGAHAKSPTSEIIRVGLLIAWVFMWALVAALVLLALIFLARLVLVPAGVLEPDFAADLFAPSQTNPGGLGWRTAGPSLLIGAIAVGGGLIIVSRLRRLYDRLAEGQPFHPENLSHLRVIWITMLAVEVSRMVLTMIMQAVFLRAVAISIDLYTWAAIIVLVAVSEIFREGVRLKREQELTI